MNICIFCSSSNALDNIFFSSAKELANLIGKNYYNIVYGGANVGLMEQIAQTVKQHTNSKIIGIIPQKIHDFELSSALPDEMIITTSMDERKKLMREKSDAFIALPGGFGTLEEILEVITLKQLDYHQKPIVFINTNGFYDKLLEQFELSYTEGFAKENYRKLYTVVETPQQAMDYINNYQHTDLGAKWFKVPHK